MKVLHVYNDGSILYSMSARALTQIPIWKGNRIIDMNHVNNIKKSIENNVKLLDSGYRIIQYLEDDNDDKPVKRSYLIDGQHRITVLSDYFSKNTETDDFEITVTEIRVESEADAINYFNRINNVKPIQFKEDPNMIINRYVNKLIKSFPEKYKFIRNGSTKRPYMSIDKFREALQKRINRLAAISDDKFVEKCLDINKKTLQELEIRSLNQKDKEIKMIQRIIELEFALAWDDKFKWLDSIIK